MDASMYELHESIENRHWWFLGRRHIVSSVLQRWLPAGSRILEVGCGTGGNLTAFGQRYAVVGIDSSVDAVDRARRLTGLEVLHGTFPDDVPRFGSGFDAILLLDVLEHIEHDTDALLAGRTYLRPEGFLILTVPALPFLWSGHDVIFHHLRRYRRNELYLKLTKAGYCVRLLAYYNFFLLPPIITARLWKHVIGDTEPHSDFVMPKPWINRLLTKVFSSEALVLGRIPFPAGASLLAIAGQCSSDEVK